MHCVNKNNPLVVQLVKDSGLPQAIALARISIFQDKNGLEKLPTAEELMNTASPTVPDAVAWESAHPKQTEIWNKLRAEETLTVKNVSADNKINEYLRPQEQNRKVELRVSNIVDRILRKPKFDESDPKTNFLADYGTKIHSDIESILGRYVNENGFIKTDEDNNLLPEARGEIKTTATYYDAMESWIRDMLTEYTTDPSMKGVRIKPESVIYQPAVGNNPEYAGTIDLPVVLPDGRMDVLDWKSYNLNKTQYKDVPWYKTKHVGVQIGEYKKVLKNTYGAVGFRRERGIPIALNVSYSEKDKRWYVKEFEIGTYNSQEEDRDYVLPIPTSQERTGNAKVDSLIDKLQALYQVMNDEKVAPDQKERKALDINATLTAIRHLQVKGDIRPTLNILQILSAEATEFSKKSLDNLTDEQLRDYSYKLIDLKNRFIPFARLEEAYNSLNLEDKELETLVGEALLDMRTAQNQLFDYSAKFYTKYIGEKNNVSDILKAELEVSVVRAYKDAQGAGRTNALTAFYRIYNEQTSGRIQFDIQRELKKLVELKEAVIKEVGNKKDMFRFIVKKGDDGSYTHKRIDTISSAFFKELQTASTAKDYKWIKENIDIETYKKWVEKKWESEKKDVQSFRFDVDPLKNTEKLRQALVKLDEKYGLRTDKAPAWFNYRQIKDFPIKDKWESKEYKELKKHPASLSFYNYITERVDAAKASGFYQGWGARTFLPFLANKKWYERMINVHSVLPQQIDEGGYKIHPLTNQRQYTLPKGTTNEIKDVADIEQDLFLAMEVFNEQLIAFQYKSTIEPMLELMRYMERNKPDGAIRANKIGNPIRDVNGKLEITGDNSKNATLLDNLIATGFYHIRDVGTPIDKKIVTFTAKTDTISRTVNEKIGGKLLPENLEGKSITLTQLLEAGTNMVRAKAMNLNFTTAISNTVGGKIQSWINRGIFYTQKDELIGAAQLQQIATNAKGGKIISGIFEELVPFTEQQSYKNRHNAAVNALQHASITEYTMKPLEWGERVVQYGIALPMIYNAVVVNGKLVNARKYVKSRYESRYNLPTADRKTLDNQIEKEIEELKKTSRLEVLTKEVDGKLVYPVNDQELSKYRARILAVIKQANGQMTSDERNLLSASHLGRSFMLFKGWIPPLFANRIKELQYVASTDSLEWGRFMIFGRVCVDSFRKGLGLTINLMAGNQKGVNYMHQLFEERKAIYETQTGKTWTASEAEFMDMMRQGIKGQWQELGYMALLITIALGLKALAPDDDKDKGKWAFAHKQMSKISQELTFFYNPLDMQSMANGSVLPALTLLTDAAHLIDDIRKEIFVDADKAHPTKDFLRMLPIFNQMSTYTAYVSDDYAKDMGIKVSGTQSFIH